MLKEITNSYISLCARKAMLCREPEKPDLRTHLLHTQEGGAMAQELGPNTHQRAEENAPLFLKDCVQKLIQEVIHFNIFRQQL